MLVVILIFLIILVIAWAVYAYLPAPVNVVGGILIFLCALVYLVDHLSSVCSGSAC